jgi:4-aminobutyrate aminotransferase
LFHTQTSPQDTAAIILEPILGEGGYVPATKTIMLALRKFCTENNILLIVDEVQSGFMRTGKWWGFEHYDVVPDIVVIAKGIASGFPLSAVAASTSVMKACPPGSLGGTYTGNAVACAAGVATMDVIEEENIQDNVNKRGQELVTGLKQLQMNKNYHIGEVRGKGLMIAIEFDDAAPKGVASTYVSCVRDSACIRNFN